MRLGADVCAAEVIAAAVCLFAAAPAAAQEATSARRPKPLRPPSAVDPPADTPLTPEETALLGNALLFDPAESRGQQAGQAAASARSQRPQQIRRQPHRQTGRLQHAGAEAAAGERMGRQGRRRSQTRRDAVGRLPAGQAVAGRWRRSGFRRGLGLGRRAQSRQRRCARRSEQRSGQARHHVQAFDAARRQFFRHAAGLLYADGNLQPARGQRRPICR